MNEYYFSYMTDLVYYTSLSNKYQENV